MTRSCGVVESERSVISSCIKHYHFIITSHQGDKQVEIATLDRRWKSLWKIEVEIGFWDWERIRKIVERDRSDIDELRAKRTSVKYNLDSRKSKLENCSRDGDVGVSFSDKTLKISSAICSRFRVWVSPDRAKCGEVHGPPFKFLLASDDSARSLITDVTEKRFGAEPISVPARRPLERKRTQRIKMRSRKSENEERYNNIT